MKVDPKFGREGEVLDISVGDLVVYEVENGYRYRCLIVSMDENVFIGTNPATGLMTGYSLKDSITTKEVKRDQSMSKKK